MTKRKTLAIAFIAFVAGCVGGPIAESLVVRPLSAQQAAAGVQRWEVHCARIGVTPRWPERMRELGNGMGAQGWRLTAIDEGRVCFERPR